MADFYNDGKVRLLLGDVREELKTIEPDSVHCVVTSPPYYAQRDYGTAQWEGGDPGCSHPAKRGHPGFSTSTLGGTQTAELSKSAIGLCPVCGAHRVDGQLGLEDTPGEYIQNLVEVFREVHRVLRKDGVFFLNIGDKMAGSGGAHKPDHANPGISKSAERDGVPTADSKGRPHWGYMGRPGQYLAPPGFKAGDMIGIPWRLAFALQADGWYLRSAIIWRKGSAMPESVSGPRWEQHRVKVKSLREGNNRGVGKDLSRSTPSSLENNPSTEWKDCPGCRVCAPNNGLILRWGNWRPTHSYEMIFMLTKSDRYYADGDAVRQPHKAESITRYFRNSFVDHEAQPYAMKQGPTGSGIRKAFDSTMAGGGSKVAGVSGYLSADGEFIGNIMGANLRDVWDINPKGFAGEHYASYPPELVRRCVAIGTSEKGVCAACGAPWARVVKISSDNRPLRDGGSTKAAIKGPTGAERHLGANGWNLPQAETQTLGWRPTCRCDAGEPIPAVVLDPFVGTGTTCFVARTMGRNSVGIDLSERYLRMAIKRIVVEGRTIS